MSVELKHKALEFIRHNPVCYLASFDEGAPVIRAMQWARIDDDFTAWFATSAASNKAIQIKADPRVYLCCYHDVEDVHLAGRGEILDDQATKDELWWDELTRFFPGGSTDPDYVVLRITPSSVKYRDFKNTGFEPMTLL